MEIAKYLCEFFFGDIIHFCGLVIVLVVISPNKIIEINNLKRDKK